MPWSSARAGPGSKIKTSKVVTAATSEGQAEARVRRLLGGSADRGELVVELRLGASATEGELSTAEVDAVVELASLAALLNQNRAGATLRVSVAVAQGDKEPVVVHRRKRLAEVPKGWIYTFPLEWSAAAGGRLAVTIEEVASGLWGGAVAELPAAP